MSAVTLKLGDESIPVTYVDSYADHEAFQEWLQEPRRALAVDTEATGLDIFSPTWKLNTVQFGDRSKAFVVPILSDMTTDKLVIDALLSQRLVMHNATFDVLALQRSALADEVIWSKLVDTSIMAHLVDPRQPQEGGVGTSLKNLASHYVHEEAGAPEVALKAHFRDMGWKIADGWSLVDPAQPVMVRYAGADVVLTARLLEYLGPLMVGRQADLYEFEAEVQRVCANMEALGITIDRSYASELGPKLTDQEEQGKRAAAILGVANVNSPAQVATVLSALGAHLPEVTDSGQPKVDKAVLEALIENDDGPAAQVAEAVLLAKRAGKWRTAYVDSVVSSLDGDGCVHPSIHSLQARTGRMSISKPPLQQLPSGDSMIRTMFVAREGHVLASVDYAQVELRILAALAQEDTMLEAIASGEDLHNTTAKLVFGDGFTKAERKLAKNIGFGKVYGGGAAHLARMSGAPLSQVKRAVARYDRVFPGVKRYGTRLQNQARDNRYVITTPAGRNLPLDRDRAYAVTNYVVQSTARDVMAQALLELDEEGFGPWMLLPIHDEILFEVPEHEAEELVEQAATIMTTEFLGRVTLLAEGEVYGRSWGDGYR